MSFQDKDLWIGRNMDRIYETAPGMENKRVHQWFMGPSEQESFSHKRQAMQSVHDRPVPGTGDVNISLWDYSSCYQSGLQSGSSQINNHPSGTPPEKTIKFADKTTSPTAERNLNTERGSFRDQFGDNLSVNLSISHSLEDTICPHPGVRKSRIELDRCSENDSSFLVGQSYHGGATMIIGDTVYQSGDISIPLGSTYDNQDMTPVGPIYGKASDRFIQLAPVFSKESENFMSNQHYGRAESTLPSLTHTLSKDNCSFISMDQQFDKENMSFMPIGPAIKCHEKFIATEKYAVANEGFVALDPPYDKENCRVAVTGAAIEKEDATTLMDAAYAKGNFSTLAMGQNYSKGERSVISFGGFQAQEANSASQNLVSDYGAAASQLTALDPSSPPERDSAKQSANQSVVITSAADDSMIIAAPAGHIIHIESATPANIAPTTKINQEPKQKEQKTSKRSSCNNFPSNVKSLLSTGILDGVPVKYVSWSREKSLRGIIKGAGYMCTCNDCKLSKILNAYEFECHAGCKTKHPNNHIYFENGKTIYGVVQELKSTPQENLFDVIQKVTGSPINQKNFRIWRESYQAATRELQRIYGKDEVAVTS